MKEFNEWLLETHPEFINEDWKDKLRKGLVAATLLGGGTAHGSDFNDLPKTGMGWQGPGTSVWTQPDVPIKKLYQDVQKKLPIKPNISDQDVQKTSPKAQSSNIKVKDGYIWVRGWAKMEDDSVRARLNAIKRAEIKAQVILTKYLYGSTGNSSVTRITGHIPPGFERVRETEKNGGMELIMKLPQIQDTND
jgi:hypothetical protein